LILLIIPNPAEFLRQFWLQIFEGEKSGGEIEFPKNEKRDDEKDGEKIELGHAVTFMARWRRDKMIFVQRRGIVRLSKLFV
jgi:hypothetical protein